MRGNRANRKRQIKARLVDTELKGFTIKLNRFTKNGQGYTSITEVGKAGGFAVNDTICQWRDDRTGRSLLFFSPISLKEAFDLVDRYIGRV